MIKILKKIKYKHSNKTQLRLILEEINDDLNWLIQGKINLSDAEFAYFEILKKYDREVVNAAKGALRDAIYRSMNPNWVYSHAINVDFKKDRKTNKMYQVLLEKYLNYFRK